MEEFRTTPRLARAATVDALGAVGAWRAPEPRRFDPRPANDWRIERQAVAKAEAYAGSIPAWLVIGAGALVAAVMGMMLGGAMAL